MNPLALVPARYRLYVYSVLSLAALAIGAWQAAEGNWTTFIAALVTSMVHAMAATNTSGD